MRACRMRRFTVLDMRCPRPRSEFLLKIAKGTFHKIVIIGQVELAAHVSTLCINMKGMYRLTTRQPLQRRLPS